MKFYEAALKLARITMEVFDGTTTAKGTETTLIDENLWLNADYFIDGTLFILTGSNNTQGVITFKPASPQPIDSGVLYCAAQGLFKINELRQALNFVLATTKYMRTDATLTASGSEEITLPDGVTHDIRRVEIAQNTSEPYNWYRHQAWDVIDGKLVFLQKPPDSGTIRIHYVATMEEITSDDGDLPITIDSQHLTWAAAAFLYRKFYDRTKEDHPEKTNLLAEAKAREEMAKATGGPWLLPRDPIIWRSI